MTKKKSGPLSLHPLPLEQAVSALLSTPPVNKERPKAKKTAKRVKS